MSIRDEIQNRIDEGRLFYLPPLLESDPCVRSMFVSEYVFNFLNDPFEDRDDERRAAQLRASLDRFSIGATITIAQEPYDKPKNTYMSPLDPKADRVFQIRDRVKPSIRVAGMFSERDSFVALAWEYRKNLGGPTDRSWRDIRERAKNEWRNLFHPYNAFLGERNEDLASNTLSV